MTPDVTEDEVIDAVRAFLVDVTELTEVFRSQDNRVPEPANSDFIVMTPRSRSRLSTNVVGWTGQQPTALDHARSTEMTVQLDVHGQSGADVAQTIATLWRDDNATSTLPAFVSPLWATDGQQMPFVNAEQQYEDRWVMTLHMQINPVVSTAQDFMDTVVATLEPPVDGA